MNQEKIIYIDMDDVLCDFTGAYKLSKETNPAIGFPQSQYGFFEQLNPKDGAIDAIQRLLQSDQYEPFILTAPSTRNPLSYTEKRVWVERKLGYDMVHRLIICAHKGLLKGAYLIDDNNNGKGQEHFEGQLLHFGSAEFPSWKEITRYLNI